MSDQIKFSAEYIDTLDKLLKVTKGFNKSTGEKKTSVLFYKNEDTPMISVMDMGALVHIRTTQQHAQYDIDEFGVTNIGDFMDYVKALKYPNNGEISISEERSTKGRTYNCIVLNDDYTKYRMIVADPTHFDSKSDKKIPVSRDKDPMELICNYMLTEEDLKRLTTDIKLMKGCEFFSLTVDNDITYYMRGSERQQVSRKVDPHKSKIHNTTALASEGLDKFRQFPARIFNFMSFFNTDFEVEIRYMESKDIVGFKAFGKIDIDGKDSIEVFIGATESTSQSMNSYDIIE